MRLLTIKTNCSLNTTSMGLRSKTKLLAVFLLIAFNCHSKGIWTKLQAKNITKSKLLERNHTPLQYDLYALDLKALKKKLSDSPNRSNRLNKSKLIIELPGEDGTLEKFEVFEASVMEPALQAKYPNIRSYAGQGIDNPSSTIRFSITEYGLHTMTIGTKGTSYTDPYTKSKGTYIVYRKSDLPTPKTPFSCGVKEDLSLDKLIIKKQAKKDGILRQYRLALVCTGEYAQFHGGNKPSVLAAMNVSMTRVNGVFERDLSLTMVIVDDNERLIFLNPDTDGLTNSSGGALLGQCQDKCDNLIGSSNYDIGHVFSTGGGGVAQLRAPCTRFKAEGVTGQNSPVGDPFDIDYVAHEMGHQYGGNHTQNNSCNRANASVEPGSASTIMGYAGICAPNVQRRSDDYFHSYSIKEMWDNVSNGSGSRCPVEISNNNEAPSITPLKNYTIPRSTTFLLEGEATDDNSSALTYCWEQMDNEVAEMPPSPNSTRGPTFRSLDPKESTIRYFPDIDAILNGQTSTEWEVLPAIGRNMEFDLTVRDNQAGGGGVSHRTMTVTVDGNSGPFRVTSQTTNSSWEAGTKELITWDVANTDGGSVNAQTVDILLSTDGGYTYPIVVADGVPNTGSYNATIPTANTNNGRIMVRGTNNIFFSINRGRLSVQGEAQPVANFSYKAINSCEGKFEFNDKTLNVPNSWTWDFGDGNTSTERNPSHTYTTDGKFTVSLTASNSVGEDKIVKTELIEVVLLSEKPEVEDVEICPNDDLTLTATSSGKGTLLWYSDIEGELLHIGNDFEPSISESTTFYVEESTSGPVLNVGEEDIIQANGSIHNGGFYLVFDVLASFTLKSFKVFAEGTKERTFELRDENDALIYSETILIPGGESRVTLNLDIEPANNLKIGFASGASLFRNNANLNYPYEIDGIVTIKGSTASSDPTGFYYYAYNWEIQRPGCNSPVEEVVVTVLPANNASCTTTGIHTDQVKNSSVYPNPTTEHVNLTLDNHDAVTSIQICNIEGQIVREIKNQISLKMTVNLSDLSSGSYLLKIVTADSVEVHQLVKK